MSTSRAHGPFELRIRCAPILGLVVAVTLAASPAHAFQQSLNQWLDRYAETPDAGVNAQCQLCHVNGNGGSPWNAYGWDIRLALIDPACDFNGDSDFTYEEAFFCVELLDSDRQGDDNVREIGLGTQPGWTLGPNNSHFSDSGETTGHEPPADIGPIDPDGSEPPPPPPPPPPDEEPIRKLKKTIVVRPGQSIQAALERVAPGGKVMVRPGVYQEPDIDPNSALRIEKSGIRLIGMSHKDRRVVLKQNGTQRQGIVVAPPERTDCLGCHTDLAPPFPRRPGVPEGMPKETDPWLYDIEIRGITIKGFPRNGLFTEHVDGFKIVDVRSEENKNYGIFPVLSRNGLITHSYASGSDDSGIWIETSENVLATHNLVERNVNGFEVSNSDDIRLAHNVARFNTVGMAILMLPDIFDDRPGAKRIDVKDNQVYDNNKDNTATPGSILATVPKGTGILYLGVDDSVVSRNLVENNEFSGIAIADYCVAVALDQDFNCQTDPNVLGNPEFLADQAASNNRIEDNKLSNNGTNGVPPFGFLAADMTQLALEDNGTCYVNNVYDTFISNIFSTEPPACE